MSQNQAKSKKHKKALFWLGIGLILSGGLVGAIVGGIYATRAYSTKKLTVSNDTNSIANDLTNYFNNNPNKLVDYAFFNGNFDATDGNVTYSNTYNNWTDAIQNAVTNYIAKAPTTYFNGILGQNVNTSLIKISNSVYEKGTLTFNLSYNNISTTSQVTLSAENFNNLINSVSTALNNLARYLEANSGMFLNYLVNNNYIILQNDTVSPSKSYSSLENALTAGITAYNSDVNNGSYYGTFSGFFISPAFDTNLNGDSLQEIANNMKNSTDNTTLINATSVINNSGTLNFNLSYLNIFTNNIVLSISNLSNNSDSFTNADYANAITSYLNNPKNQVIFLENANLVCDGPTSWFLLGNETWQDAVEYYFTTFGGIYNVNGVDIDGNAMANDINLTDVSFTNNNLSFLINYNNSNATEKVYIQSDSFIKAYNDLESTVEKNYLLSGLTNKNNQLTFLATALANNLIIYSNNEWTYNSNAIKTISTSYSSVQLSNESSYLLFENMWSVYFSSNFSTAVGLNSFLNNFVCIVNGVNVTITSTGWNVNLTILGKNYNFDFSNSEFNLAKDEISPPFKNLDNYLSTSTTQEIFAFCLMNNDFVIYENNTFNYSSSYTSWNEALDAFFAAANTAFNPMQYINGTIISFLSEVTISDANYSNNVLSFKFTYNNQTSNLITIPESVLLDGYKGFQTLQNT